jgi:hypothetical protein
MEQPKGGSRIFCRAGSNSRRESRNFGWRTDNVHPLRGGSSIFKSRCSERRFQASPDGTILAQNDVELLCEAREGLTAC